MIFYRTMIMNREFLYNFGDTEQDFFEQNPDLRYLPAYNRLIKVYGKDNASRIAWVVVLINHPDSRISRREDKFELMQREYLKELAFDFESETYIELVESFNDDMLSPIQSELSEFLIAMRKSRRDVLSSDDANKVATFIEKYPKSMQQIRALQMELIKDEKTLVKRKLKGQQARNFNQEEIRNPENAPDIDNDDDEDE